MRIPTRWLAISAVVALLLTALLAALIFYREQDKPFGFELEWMREVVLYRDDVWTAVARVFDYVGGGWLAITVIPIGITVGLLLLRRPWAALYFISATAVTAGVVQLIKQLVGRPRPEDILVVSDFGSFPSGHSANAAMIATVLGIIFARAWVWALGSVYTIAMMPSRTYLGAHWISDTIGGVLIGVGVAVIAWCLLRRKLMGEPVPRNLPAGKLSG